MKWGEKIKSLKSLRQENLLLQISVLVLSCLCTFLVVLIFAREDRWVLIPMNMPEKRMVVTNEGVTAGYLREWAQFVAERLFNASSETVESQIDSLRVLASRNDALDDFFKKHTSFVKGSNIESAFYPSGFKVFPNAVQVKGLFKYWVGSKGEQPISQQKTYRFTFKRGVNDLILLKNVEEVCRD